MPGPQVSQTPGFRQYDLFIDGQSFFTMPKLYELGIKGPIASEARAPGVINRAERSSRALPPLVVVRSSHVEGEPRSREEEEIELAKAISASLEESRQHLKKTVESHRAQDPSPALPARSPAAPLRWRRSARLWWSTSPSCSCPCLLPAPPMPRLLLNRNTHPTPHSFVELPFRSSAAQPGAMVPVAPQPGAPYGGYGGAPVPPATQYGAAPVRSATSSSNLHTPAPV